MPNNYYNYQNDLLPGTKTRSQEIDEQFAAIEAGFDLLADSDDLTVGANLGGIDSGASDAYDVNTGGTSTLVDLQLVTFVPLETNTGASTLTYNGSSNFPIVRNDGTIVQGGDLIQGVPTMLLWDGTNSRWVHVGATAAQSFAGARPVIRTEAGSTYTLQVSDELNLILFTGACTVTAPSNVVAAIPVGAIIHLHQAGTGQVTVVNGVGANVYTAISKKTRTTRASLSLMKIALNDWVIVGDTELP